MTGCGFFVSPHGSWEIGSSRRPAAPSAGGSSYKRSMHEQSNSENSSRFHFWNRKSKILAHMVPAKFTNVKRKMNVPIQSFRGYKLNILTTAKAVNKRMVKMM